MTMRCISVYTSDYEIFSDIYEEIMGSVLEENEEKEIKGITVSDSGGVPEAYIQEMRQKPEVAVMKVRQKGIVILQHGDVFEILYPVQANL